MKKISVLSTVKCGAFRALRETWGLEVEGGRAGGAPGAHLSVAGCHFQASVRPPLSPSHPRLSLVCISCCYVAPGPDQIGESSHVGMGLGWTPGLSHPCPGSHPGSDSDSLGDIGPASLSVP